MNKKVEEIFAFLDERFSDAHCELNYTKDYELVIAVLMSAQATDKSVNIATEKLFKAYPTFESLAEADPKEIQSYIHSVGLSKTKAQNISKLAKILIEKYDVVVPSSREELESLPGVGRKTTNVVRIEYFKIPEMPVDTHVNRVSKRLGLAKEEDDLLTVEKKLRIKIPRERLIKAHHQFIFFGRYLCKSQNPLCEECPFTHMCNHYKLNQKKKS